jgi:hypothetical protein
MLRRKDKPMRIETIRPLTQFEEDDIQAGNVLVLFILAAILVGVILLVGIVLHIRK